MRRLAALGLALLAASIAHAQYPAVCVVENWYDAGTACVAGNPAGCGAVLVTGSTAPGRGNIVFCDAGTNDLIGPTKTTDDGTIVFDLDINTKAKLAGFVADWTSTDEIMMGDGRGFLFNLSAHLATQITDEEGSGLVVFNDDPTFNDRIIVEDGAVFGTGATTGDQMAWRIDMGGIAGDDWYDIVQFYDHSARANVSYAGGIASSGHIFRTLGGGAGSGGFDMLHLSKDVVTFGHPARVAQVTFNGDLIAEGESNFQGGFRKGEKTGIVASTTQTLAAATKCEDAEGDPMNICIIATVANVGDSVKLSLIFDGRNQCWYNDGANLAWLFPGEAGTDLGNGNGNKMDVAVADQVCCETAGGSRQYCTTHTPE